MDSLLKEINVIHIFGASGSGTTTLGKMIFENYGYHQLDVDNYFWIKTEPPFTTKREINERIKLLKNDIQKYRKVVITGSLCGWGDWLIPYFDLAIRTTINKELRIARIKEREQKRYGKKILEGGELYRSHQEFIEWASQYDDGDKNIRSKILHDEWQKNLKCKLIVLDTSRELNMILAELTKHL